MPRARTPIFELELKHTHKSSKRPPSTSTILSSSSSTSKHPRLTPGDTRTNRHLYARAPRASCPLPLNPPSATLSASPPMAPTRTPSSRARKHASKQHRAVVEQAPAPHTHALDRLHPPYCTYTPFERQLRRGPCSPGSHALARRTPRAREPQTPHSARPRARGPVQMYSPTANTQTAHPHSPACTPRLRARPPSWRRGHLLLKSQTPHPRVANTSGAFELEPVTHGPYKLPLYAHRSFEREHATTPSRTRAPRKRALLAVCAAYRPYREPRVARRAVHAAPARGAPAISATYRAPSPPSRHPRRLRHISTLPRAASRPPRSACGSDVGSACHRHVSRAEPAVTPSAPPARRLRCVSTISPLSACGSDAGSGNRRGMGRGADGR
ncbi:hypothetical protein C8R44DRAFT_876928 [Mycena epipterygia]|nr:hypothetical protein C8R44DRAFT_876928 [Mycena epipterygia]